MQVVILGLSNLRDAIILIEAVIGSQYLLLIGSITRT